MTEQRQLNRRNDDRIHERLATIEERVSNLCELLTDNGQPGALTRIDNRISAVSAQIDDLNGWRRWVHGIALAVSVIVGIVAWAWEHLRGRTP